MARWQVQAAKQRLSELLRAAQQEGAQIVTKHGADIAVVLDIAEYRALIVEAPDFKDYVMDAPLQGLDITRDRTPARVIEFAD